MKQKYWALNKKKKKEKNMMQKYWALNLKILL